MDPHPLKTGSSFTEFPGNSFNALVSDYFQRKGSAPTTQPPSRGTSGRIVVNCHNSTSTTIEPGEILGFSAPIFTTEPAPDGDPNQVYSAPNIKGIAPAVADHANRFVVAIDYIRGTGDVTGGAIGPAALTGLAWCKINWTDESHTHVKVEEGETKLQSATSGIKPVWHEDIPDAEYLPADVWALVLLGSGGGSTGTTLREARVTVDIPAQTLNDDGDGWRIHDTPGRVILVDSAGFDTGEDFEVTNRDDQFYAANCRVWLDGTRVDHGSCWPVEWPTEPET